MQSDNNSNLQQKLIWYSKDTRFNDLNAVTDAAFANLEGYGSQVGYLIKSNNKVVGSSFSRAKLTCTSSIESKIYAVSRATPILGSLKLLIPNISKAKLNTELKSDSISLRDRV